MNALMQKRLAPLAGVYQDIAGAARRQHRLADLDGNDHRALADWGYLGEPVTGAVLDPPAVHAFIRPLLSDVAFAQVMATTKQPPPKELADRGYLDRQARTDYRLDVFGDPSAGQPWAWRLNGPHVGLHLTVRSEDIVCALPLFIGESDAGSGDRAETSLVRVLVDGLTTGQRHSAQVDPQPPIEIRTRHDPRVFLPGVPDGIAYGGLHERQRTCLDALVLHHLGALRPLGGLGAVELHHAGLLEAATFAYAGNPTSDSDWYYCVKSERLVIEYLNQRGHVHCVMRDPQADWAGLDQTWPKI